MALTIAARFLIWFTFERPAAGSVAAVPTSAWRALLATAWPLGMVMRIGSVSSNLPRYLAEGFMGHAALGTLIVNSIGQAAMSPLARVAAAGDAADFTIFCERVSALTWEHRKPTWLLFALLPTHAAAATTLQKRKESDLFV